MSGSLHEKIDLKDSLEKIEVLDEDTNKIIIEEKLEEKINKLSSDFLQNENSELITNLKDDSKIISPLKINLKDSDIVDNLETIGAPKNSNKKVVSWKDQNIINVQNDIPKVYTIDNYLTDEECEHMIELSKGNLKKSLVSGTKEGFVSTGRTGLNYWIPHNKDQLTLSIGEKIAKQVGLPLENAEAFQMIYYGETQEYKQHYDGWLFDGGEKSRRNMKFGGQRMVTALCYLNDVEEGGGTNFPRLKCLVQAKKGRMVVFHNVIEGSNKRHELSEHAGMPVIKGEKWAFNLWFREESRKKLYDYKVDPEFASLAHNNPIVKEVKSVPENENIIKDDNNLNDLSSSSNSYRKFCIDESHSIYYIPNFIDNKDNENLIKNCNFNNDERAKSWIKKDKVPDFIKKIENLTGINSEFYENLCVVKYKSQQVHNNHLDAYDLETENGKKFTNKVGQRLYSITCTLTDKVAFEFSKLNKRNDFMKNSVIIYKNTHENSNIREENITKKIILGEPNSIIVNIYIREKSLSNNSLSLKENILNNSSEKNESSTLSKNRVIPINFEEKEVVSTIEKNATDSDLSKKIDTLVKEEKNDNILKKVNYTEILETVYKKIENGDIFKTGYNEMKFNGKVPWDELTKYVKKLYDIRKNNNHSVLNIENLDKTYKIDEFTPVVVENVYNKEASELFIEYFSENIKKNAFMLGDKQANRYKAHNEPFCRFMHYEILPLIEKITNFKLEPTYTYLSCYKKGTDLPAHTDRPECEYTVSFIIDKPENCNWNIYVHKTKQPVKGKGRYNFTPDKSECIPVDCNKNGLMIFQGEDHIHFREELQGDYYNIVLLHFRKV